MLPHECHTHEPQTVNMTMYNLIMNVDTLIHYEIALKDALNDMSTVDVTTFNFQGRSSGGMEPNQGYIRKGFRRSLFFNKEEGRTGNNYDFYRKIFSSFKDISPYDEFN